MPLEKNDTFNSFAQTPVLLYKGYIVHVYSKIHGHVFVMPIFTYMYMYNVSS